MIKKPDTTTWSALDFAIAYDGLCLAGAVLNGVICQPRAMIDHQLLPGTALLDDIAVLSLDPLVDGLMADLAQRVYPTAAEEQQRISLLIKYWMSLGVSSSECLIRIAVEEAKLAAA